MKYLYFSVALYSDHKDIDPKDVTESVTSFLKEKLDLSETDVVVEIMEHSDQCIDVCQDLNEHRGDTEMEHL